MLDFETRLARYEEWLFAGDAYEHLTAAEEAELEEDDIEDYIEEWDE